MVAADERAAEVGDPLDLRVDDGAALFALVTSPGVDVEVDPILHRLLLRHLLEEDAGTSARRVDDGGKPVPLPFRDRHRPGERLPGGKPLGRWLHDVAEHVRPERGNATLAANLTATFLTARAFLRHAAQTGSGSLVLIGSTAGIFGEAGHSDYAAAKGGIITGLLLSAKNEAARIGPGVRVNAVAPGWTVTPMIGDKGLDEAHVERVTATMALKKLGRPEDVAAHVVVLASDELSGHVSGHVVSVSGGMEGRLVP